jgi:hypothetical protein
MTSFDTRKATVSLQPAALFNFDFFDPLPIQIEVSEAPLTSDAGLLPLRQFDERIALTKQLAAVLDDPRDPELTEHTFLEMVRSRVYAILAGYEDQNDHDILRADPVFKLVADRSPEADDLVSAMRWSNWRMGSSPASPESWPGDGSMTSGVPKKSRTLGQRPGTLLGSPGLQNRSGGLNPLVARGRSRFSRPPKMVGRRSCAGPVSLAGCRCVMLPRS